jgi:hypothetical protein
MRNLGFLVEVIRNPPSAILINTIKDEAGYGLAFW